MTTALLPSRWGFRPLFRDAINAAGLLVAIYFAADALLAILASLARVDFFNLRAGLRPIHQIMLPSVVSIWAMVRARLYHPMGDAKYSAWLETTPWNAKRTLPLGPLHLVWEDFIFLAVATALTCDARIPMLGPAGIFLAFYTLLLLNPAFSTVPVVVRYAMGFGWAAAIFWWPNQAIVGVIVLILYVVSQYGLQQSLLQFPWKSRAAAEERKLKEMRTTRDWRLGPRPPDPMPLLHGLLVPALVGAWVFGVMSKIGVVATWNHDNDGLIGAPAMAGLVVALVRWTIYCGTLHPPISTWGRLWTGRLIIPGYDYVLLAPLCTAIVGSLSPIPLRIAGFNPPLTMGISAFVILSCALNLPPTLRRWQLTGHHQIVVAKTTANSRRNQEKIEF